MIASKKEGFLVYCCLEELTVLRKGEHLHTDQTPKIPEPLYFRHHHTLYPLSSTLSPGSRVSIGHSILTYQVRCHWSFVFRSGCLMVVPPPSRKLPLPQELPEVTAPDVSFLWMAGPCSPFSISLPFRWRLLDDTLHGSEITDFKEQQAEPFKGY